MQRVRSRTTRFAVSVMAAALVALPGLGVATAQDANDLTIFAMYKRLDQGWFQNEAAGAEAAASELGISIVTLDNRFDANVMTSNLDSALSQGADGLIMVVPDQQLGPAVIARANEAGVPLIAVDDAITDAEGNPAPFVGMDTVQIGSDVGAVLIEEATARDYFAEGNEVRVAALTFSELDVCNQRTDATKAALLAGLPDLEEADVIEADYAGANTDGGFQTMSGLITSHPDASHWLVYSCNEEGVVGAVRALEAAGKDQSACGVGLGDGALAKLELLKDEANAYCGSLFIDSANHGATAVRLLHDYLANGTEIPLETLTPGTIVTRDNAREVFEGGAAATPAA